MDTEDRNEAIKIYFGMGLQYKDIIRTLALDGCAISLRQLKRILRQLGLSRYNNYSNVTDVIDFVQSQIQQSGVMHGYRWMHEKCLLNNIRCTKEGIRTILGILNPEGTEQRRRRRLLRRSYYANGPNYLWHLDSYDKLKRYGICINGCIDGFSRKVVWLNVYHTSSDPKLIGGYYMEAVESLGGCPHRLRADRGTENGYVRDIQRLLRVNENSYLEGRSTSNQRIEYWWSFLRRECTDFWICLFRDLLDNGDFDGDLLDVNLVRFCFMHLIQADLDDTVSTWNRHLIRPSNNARMPSGRPNIMYNMPHLYGTVDYISHVSTGEINICKGMCTFRKLVPCDKDVYDLCWEIIGDMGYSFPHDPYSAVDLYLNLRHDITSLL